MDIDKASLLFRKIIKSCPEFDGNSFIIMHTQAIPLAMVANGYEIAIRVNKGSIEEKTLKKLRRLADKEGLTCEVRETATLIYSPKLEKI